ncbi:hypothetical protein [Phreatobacter cathodiphilus]|uniref:YARHG domain-containing protein n=1 Tax=Phreatobacter cathodiphilus TaxID=1868589 RepID=A0A2S0NEV3_9HYPH|nr:hypothetical protein [Phreatobacter cathodiphilus]AVO46682.1 hypothetical protein C6569_17330 [Phreatobacter cathodiphilus]
MPRRAVLLLSLAFAAVGGEHAAAQMQLPGAVAPTPQGATTPQGRPQAPRATVDGMSGLAGRSVPASTLRRWEEALPGRTLRFLGQHGSLVISRAGTPTQPTYTIAATGVIGRRGNDIRNICTPDLGGGRPVPLRPLGRPDGLPRFEANFTGCTITLDLMADAAFVTAPGGACSFDDCVVDPAGLWGPNDREIPADREIERARGVAERRLNDARRILQARLRTTPEGRQFLQEQAGFPANRERLCRNYGTTDIGPAFCALKFTEARAENLAARVGGPPADAPPRRPARPRPPPPPAAPQQ